MLDPHCPGVRALLRNLGECRRRGLDARRLSLLNGALVATHRRVCDRCRNYRPGTARCPLCDGPSAGFAELCRECGAEVPSDLEPLTEEEERRLTEEELEHMFAARRGGRG